MGALFSCYYTLCLAHKFTKDGSAKQGCSDVQHTAKPVRHSPCLQSQRTPVLPDIDVLDTLFSTMFMELRDKCARCAKSHDFCYTCTSQVSNPWDRLSWTRESIFRDLLFRHSPASVHNVKSNGADEGRLLHQCMSSCRQRPAPDHHSVQAMFLILHVWTAWLSEQCRCK